jgi:tRNA-2-methylthio-N6-dimethylallyladenosine synthase
VSVGEGRKDTGGRLSGRARDNRLVHLAAAPGVRPGRRRRDRRDEGRTALPRRDGAPLRHRRTRAGGAWEAGRLPVTPGVSLGMPVVGVPAPLAPAVGCGEPLPVT